MTISKSDVEHSQSRYLDLVASMPPVRERSAEQMAEVDEADKLMVYFNRLDRALDEEYRRQRQEDYAAETRRIYPWLGERSAAD